MINQSILVPQSQIKDFYNFLFFDGVYIDENKKFTSLGWPNMGQKKAFFSFYIEGVRFSKNLKIQGKEGAFFGNVFAGAEDSILVPFASGAYGLNIYIFFWVRLSGEGLEDSTKRIELTNYFTKGGAVKIKDLFFEAMAKKENEAGAKIVDINEQKINSSVDYVEFKNMKYKVTLYDSGEIEVFNITKNTELADSPPRKKIFNLSKFAENKSDKNKE